MLSSQPELVPCAHGVAAAVGDEGAREVRLLIGFERLVEHEEQEGEVLALAGGRELERPDEAPEPDLARGVAVDQLHVRLPSAPRWGAPGCPVRAGG